MRLKHCVPMNDCFQHTQFLCRMKILSTGLILLLVAIVGSVVGGVCLCAHFYKEGKRKSQVRPEDQLAARMVEPFSTKKLWERGRKKPIVVLTESESVKSISINGVIAKGPASDAGDEEGITPVGDAGCGGINPSSTRTPSPVAAAVEIEPEPTKRTALKDPEPVSATTVVEVS